jgi:hypothetical protein
MKKLIKLLLFVVYVMAESEEDDDEFDDEEECDTIPNDVLRNTVIGGKVKWALLGLGDEKDNVFEDGCLEKEDTKLEMGAKMTFTVKQPSYEEGALDSIARIYTLRTEKDERKIIKRIRIKKLKQKTSFSISGK